MEDETGLLVHSVMFRPDGLIEISFAKDSEEVDRAAMLRTVVFDRDVFATPVQELVSDVSDLIDQVLAHIRNPTSRKEEDDPKEGAAFGIEGF